MKVYEELKVKQKQGYTAAKLYGPAAKKADDIINGPKRELENKPPKFWESALDNGLLMFSYVLCNVRNFRPVFKTANCRCWVVNNRFNFRNCRFRTSRILQGNE